MTTDHANAAGGAPAPAEEWAIVEIMGHMRTAGRISEEERFGSKLLRVDRPFYTDTTEEGTIWVTSFHAGSAIYQLHLCDEETARSVAQSLGDPRPRKPHAPPALAAFRPAEPEPERPFEMDDEDFESVL